MKTIEELKIEQSELKAKLHELVEIINSEEYFGLSPREKGLLGQQRAGMEMYLNALTNRIYSKDDYSFDASSLLWPMMMGTMFSSSSGFGSTGYLKDQLKVSDFETKEEQDE
jgi:hypothetical protein